MRSAIRWGGLRTKIIAWSFIPTIILLLAVAVVLYFAYQAVAQDLVLERNRELALLMANSLSAEMREYANRLTAEARSPNLVREDPVTRRVGLVTAQRRLGLFDAGVLLLDTYGTIRDAEPARPDQVGQDWSDRSYYRDMLRLERAGTSEAIFSDIVTDGPDGAPVVVVAVPIAGDRGQFLGLLAGMFRVGASSVSAFYGDIIKLRPGGSGDAYLVDGQGTVIYHRDAQRIGQDLASDPLVERVTAGELGAVRTQDLDGREIVASFAPVPGTSWGLVTEESWADLTSSSRRYGQFLLLLLVLGVAVPTVVVALGVRRITRPITDLIAAVQQVASGDLSQTISAQTGDEIQELAIQFNVMSAQLRDSYARLEQTVTDRTRELAAVNAIAAVASQSQDLIDLLTNALDKTLEVIGVEAGGIYLVDEAAGALNVAAQRGLSPRFVAEVDHLAVGEGFSGRVVQSGEPLVIRDVAADPRLTRMAVREEGFHSLATVPLRSRGKVLGTLFAVSYGFREFTEQDVELLVSIGHQIGIAVQNARLFESEHRRAEQFRVIAEVGHQIALTPDVNEMLDQIVRLIHKTLGYYLVGIALIEGDELVFKAGAGAVWENPDFRPPRIEVGHEGITGWVASSGEPLLVPDLSRDPRYYSLPEASEMQSELAVPLKTKEKVIGVLHVQSNRLNAFDDTDLSVLQSLAQQAGAAIENAQLYEQVRETAVLQERQRLARDLHDAVTQNLFSASLIAEALPRLWETDPEEGRELLGELRNLSRGALAEMRTLLLELRPSALADAGLDDLLRQLADAVQGRTGVPVQLAVLGHCSLSAEVHLALYRIAQEALNNVVKHAAARQVLVRLECASSAGVDSQPSPRVELEIRDDGRGFDLGAVPSDRLGLGNIRERAQAIGASLQVDSRPRQGTRVRVLWQASLPTKADERPV